MSEACSKDVCLTDEPKRKKKSVFETYKVYVPAILSFDDLITLTIKA